MSRPRDRAGILRFLEAERILHKPGIQTGKHKTGFALALPCYLISIIFPFLSKRILRDTELDNS